ncbi:hypothetical protein [uncultured Pontibacter sp.]|uniref:hypothetical protein n=1 Tax=uncultured Pontibacter sp. TaxID=453356 RepID=UPI002619A52A|nr:hypothetical protein [uncultured Pontibacter sp.]
MKTLNLIIFLLLTTQAFAQNKPMKYYGENGREVSEQVFFESRNYSQNLDLYFEDDSTHYGLLVTRQNSGKLDQQVFEELKAHLTQISGKQVDATKNIVVNYLTAFPEKIQPTTPKSAWNMFDKDYLRKLHKIAAIEQFWLNSPEAENLAYYHKNSINWIEDKGSHFQKVFFPYEVGVGNFVLLKPDGQFYYYLGEHGKQEVWEKAQKYFK